MKSIKVWQFYDAPKRYQKVASQGGDEDWLAFVPYGFTGVKDKHEPYIPWLEVGGFGCCNVQWIEVKKGWLVVGTHS